MKKVINHPSFRYLLFGFSLLFLFISFYDYNRISEKHIETEMIEITGENNQLINGAITNKIKDQLEILQNYAKLIAYHEDITSKEVFDLLEPLTKEDLFTNVAITTPDGISYTSPTHTSNNSERKFFVEGMKGKTIISDMITSKISNEQVIVMSVPIYKQAKVIGVLRVSMSTTLLPEYFNLSFLSGNISSFIIQRDGVNLTPKKNYYNFFHMLEKDERNKGIEKEMKEKLANGDHGYITFKLNNKTRYAYFSDVEGTNWYLLSVLPHSYVTERINHNLTHTLLLAGKVCVLLLIIGIYLLYLMNESRKEEVKNQEKLHTIISNTPGISFKHKIHNPASIQFFNDNRKLYAGYSKEELLDLISTDLSSIVWEEDLPIVEQLNRPQKKGTVVSNTYRILLKNGHMQWIFDQRQSVLEKDHTIWLYITVLDVTGMRETQERLRLSEERYAMILKETRSIPFEWNVKADTITFSDAWTNTFAHPKVIDHFLSVTNKYFKDREYTYIPLMENMIRGQSSDQIECILPSGHNENIWVKIHAKALYDNNGFLTRIIGSILDISEEKEKTSRLIKQSQIDGLTGLYNRITIEHLINEACQNNPDSSLILFVIDVDDFKKVNDTYGHASGDEALINVSKALRKCFRSDDLIGRIGGDEFVVLMKANTNVYKELPTQKISMLKNMLSNIHIQKDINFVIHCSIGISIHPQDGTNYKELFTWADHSMYEAKKHGKNTFVYQPKNTEKP